MIDFYGTISAGDREVVEATCGDVVAACGLSMSPGELAIRWGERFFAEIEQSNHDGFRTLYECEIESLRVTLAELGHTPDPRPLVERLERYWADPPVYPDAMEFLRQVDVPVCCVSNADTEPLLAALKTHGLTFDAVVTSEDARCYKPDPGIFEVAMGALSVEPGNVLHIGDSLHSDVEGASKLGIATAWICRKSRVLDLGTCRPDFKIEILTSLAQFPDANGAF
jgi:2-haloacid dehalogenase/putative hydrolase of the HAD superfamily